MKGKREFNFAQRWVDGLAKESKSPAKWKTQALFWGTGSLLFIGVVGSAPWLWEFKVQSDVAQVHQKISSLGELASQVNRLKALKAQLEGQEQLLDLTQKSTRDPGLILDKLKKHLPIGTLVNSFTLQENTLTLGVSVPTPVDVARLWVSLRDSGMFQEVDIQTVSLEDKVQTLNFNLMLK